MRVQVSPGVQKQKTMTKGTRMWFTGLVKVGFWLAVTGLALTKTIEKYDERSWWVISFAVAVIGSIDGIIKASKLIEKSHTEE